MTRSMLALVAVAFITDWGRQPERGVQIDHLILAINDMDRGIAEFERRTGVRAVLGGTHPGRGTQNALVSLGDGMYIEILAPNPHEPDPPNPMFGLRDVPELRPSGWALTTTDVGAIRRRQGASGLTLSPVRPGSRALPDGSTLKWKTIGVLKPRHHWMPFFIEWADPSIQPSRTSPGGCRLASIELQDPDPAALRLVFDAVGFEMPLKQGSPAQMTITLDCPKGTVTFQ